jgi:hypothetical protein
MNKFFRNTLLTAAFSLIAALTFAQTECLGHGQPYLTIPDQDGVNHQVFCGQPGVSVYVPTLAAGGVTSVFTRTGAVVATASDYSAVSGLNLGDGTGSLAFTTASNEFVALGDGKGDFFEMGNVGAVGIANVLSNASGWVNLNGGFRVLGSTGFISQVNGVSVSGQGVPPIYFSATANGLTANYNSGSAKTLYTPVATNSVFRVCSVEATTNTPTAGTLPSLTVGWTDPASVARTLALYATASSSANTTLSQACVVIHTNGSTAITVTSAGYAAGSGTALAYELAVSLEEII